MFKPLTKDNINPHRRSDDRRHQQRRLEDREIKVELTDEAKKYVVDHGYDPVYGSKTSETVSAEECGDTGCEGHPGRPAAGLATPIVINTSEDGQKLMRKLNKTG